MVHDERLVSSIERGEIGVGQLFRELKIQPDFKLLACGSLSRSASWPRAEYLTSLSTLDEFQFDLWRDYTLSSAHISCRFLELFRPNFLGLSTKSIS